MIRLQASGIMIAGQAAFEAVEENLLLGTLTRLRKVEDQILAVKVQVGAVFFFFFFFLNQITPHAA